MSERESDRMAIKIEIEPSIYNVHIDCMEKNYKYVKMKPIWHY